MKRDELEKYVLENYPAELDYPWEESTEYAVLRHGDNRKWFALFMKIAGHYLGLSADAPVDVVNLKCDPELAEALVREGGGIFPAYHMNKRHWVTVLLDGSVDAERVKALVDMSFGLTEKKLQRSKKR